LFAEARAGADREDLDGVAARLERIAAPSFLRRIADDAQDDLGVAHAGGRREPPRTDLRERIDASPSPFERWARFAFLLVVGWLTAFALLAGLGEVLSAATMRAITSAPVEASGRARGADSVLRRAYRVVLWVICAYYYVSMPVVASLVVAVGAGVVYACIAIGRIPVQLVFFAAALVLGSLSAIVRSMFSRARDADPGERVNLSENVALRDVLNEVAKRVGTRPVDSVYITPTTEIAVFERGGMFKQVTGRSERCLVLGIAVLEGMRVRELKAILAHEYGHFRNEDTAGGGFALAVRRSLMRMVWHLVVGRSASEFNPAWWFVRGFHAVFLRISQGASRLQEVLADRWAAFAYGSEAFARGLEHVVDRSVRFDAHVSATLGEVAARGEPLANVYTFVPTEPLAPAQIEMVVAQAMNRPAEPSDSHPPPKDRIAWVIELAAPPPDGVEGGAAAAWSLLVGREAIETRMSAAIQASLRASIAARAA
jgi:Zn-dependent protease with chaperone function